MHADDLAFATVPVRALGAAVLQTWGCPTIIPGKDAPTPPVHFSQFGVAFAGRVMADADGDVHNSLCPSARAARPVLRGRLLGPWGPALRHCMCRGEVEAWVATDGSPTFVAEVKQLISELDDACRSARSSPRSEVEGEMDAVDAGRQVLKHLARFRDAVVAPPGLEQAVDAAAASFETFVADRVRRLRQDGIGRLTEALAWRVDAEAVALAEGSVPADTASVACVLICFGRLNAGVAEASSLSVMRRGQFFLEEDTAVVVLPRRSAVLLKAWLSSDVADSTEGTVVLCRPVDECAPQLCEVGAATLELMADGRCDAATAWDAAWAASY